MNSNIEIELVDGTKIKISGNIAIEDYDIKHPNLTLNSKSKNEFYNIRRITQNKITIDDIRSAINENRLSELIMPFDEIDIPIDTGENITVICGYSHIDSARFVFKNCWDMDGMNDEATNEGGYYNSKGRAHILTDVLPHITQEWREIIKPRKMIEKTDNGMIEYEDLMWLPSATDVFGPSEKGYWKDLDGSFQLPIFKRERDRVKECGSEGTYPYWLRSVSATNSTDFCFVYTDGSASGNIANWSIGFTPGFDIGRQSNE